MRPKIWMELKLCVWAGRNIQIYPREFWERVENYFILKPQEIAVGNSILRKVSEENFNLLPRVLRDYQDGDRNQSKKLNVTEFFKRNLEINKNGLSFRLWPVFFTKVAWKWKFCSAGRSLLIKKVILSSFLSNKCDSFGIFGYNLGQKCRIRYAK